MTELAEPRPPVNIFALGSGTITPDCRAEVECDSSCDDSDCDGELGEGTDLRSIADAAERTRHEDSRRRVAMRRRRIAVAEEAAGDFEDGVVALEPQTHALETRLASRRNRALSYLSGDDDRLEAYRRHHEAEVRALRPSSDRASSHPHGPLPDLVVCACVGTRQRTVLKVH